MNLTSVGAAILVNKLAAEALPRLSRAWRDRL
jgi:hypothetical protein